MIATPVIDINANLFRAAAVCASSHEPRKYLCRVWIEKHPTEGALLVATDGHRLIVIYDRTVFCRKSIGLMLDRAGLNACKPPKNGNSRLRIADDGVATIDGCYQSEGSVIVPGSFPDWRAVVPVKAWKNCPTSFNAQYLADFAKIGAMLSQDHSGNSIRILTGDTDSDGALILFPRFSDAFAILMPMRADVGGGLPAWMRPVMARKNKRKAKAGEAQAA